MNTKDWIEEHKRSVDLNEGLKDEGPCIVEVIETQDLEELLQTHVILPKKMTKKMKGAMNKALIAHMLPQDTDVNDDMWAYVIEASNE